MAYRPAIDQRRLREAPQVLERRLSVAMLLLFFVAAGVYALVQLQIMIGDIKRVDARLETLSVMSRQFQETNRSLNLTNTLLAETNAKIDAMSKRGEVASRRAAGFRIGRGAIAPSPSPF